MYANRFELLARRATALVFTLAVVIAVTIAAVGPNVATARPGGKKFKTVTRTFSNSAAIAIPEEGAANPFPSTIDVAGLRKGKIKDVNLRLRDFSHVIVDDVDLLIMSPDNRAAIVMSDVSDGDTVNDVNLTLDDQAAEPLSPDDPLTSGAFQPLNVDDSEIDVFPPPAPETSANVALSTFNGGNPNGQWQLFVVDDQDGFTGDIAGGWELQITAKVKQRHGNGKRN
jgi:hypothetical protein